MTPRTVILVAGLLTFSASVAGAQPSWSLGAKGGVNFATFYGDASEGATTATAFAVGGAGMVQLHENFGIGLEVLYSRKGAKDDFSGETLKLDYIEIPVLAVGILPMDSSVDILGYVGPAVGFNVKADFAGVDVKDTIGSTDFGAAFGAGVAFDTGQVKITVEGRVTVGFIRIDSAGSEEVKNRAISALLGVMFPLPSGP